MITVSAPGKIHLLGEHSVVYGKPAILAAIDKRLYVTIKTQNKKEIIINIAEKDNIVREAIRVFKKSFAINKLPSLEITVTSQIPSGSGLGSSAALSAALLGGLMKSMKNIWNPQKINELTYEVEKTAHGNPSGADNTTIVFGGLIWFRREFDFLKSIWSLPMTAYKIPKFAIIDSGKPVESTREMVSNVARLYEKEKKKMSEIFSDQEIQTKNLLLALKTDDREQLTESIKQGEKNLEKMGVVGDFAQKIIREIEVQSGAAKICGAGGRKKGSGILLCYHQDQAKIKKVAEKFTVSMSPIILGGEGIRIENILKNK